jgi:hypothetical protein
MWMRLGLHEIIEDSIQVDRSGSAVLEHLLQREDRSIPGYDYINLHELVFVTCWYLWWIRRRCTHGEDVPPPFKYMLSILSITSNSAAANQKKGAMPGTTWSKPNPRQMKLNVDASFHIDAHAGAIAAVIRDYNGNLMAAKCTYLSDCLGNYG